MDKRKFLWLTIPVVSTMAVAAIILLIMQDHFVAVLLVCYFLGVVIGDMLCAKDESSWIINWLSGQRQAQKEVDAEYGTDAEIARRNATDAQSYLAGRVIGGFFKLLFRLLALAFVVAAAGVSWIVRVIVNFVRWMKDKQANAASAAPQSQAGAASSAPYTRSAKQKKQNTGKIVAISVTGGIVLVGVLIGVLIVGKTRARAAEAQAATDAPWDLPIVTAESDDAAQTGQAANGDISSPDDVAPSDGTTDADDYTDADEYTDDAAATPASKFGVDVTDLDVVPTASEFFDVSHQATMVVQGTMNVRSGPDKSYTKLSTLSLGDVRTAVAAKDDWFLVEYRSNTYGWVSGKLAFGAWMFASGLNRNLNGLTEPSQYLTAPTLKTIAADGGADLRSGPSESRSLLDHCKKGLSVAVIASDGDWYFVNRSGQYGWMHGDGFVAVEAATDAPQEVDTLGDGNYHIVFLDTDGVQQSGSYYLIRVSLMEEYALTQDEIDRACNGETVTVHGYTIPSDIHLATEEDDRVPMYCAGEDTFIYRSATGLYAVYPPDQGDARCYSLGKAWVRLSAATEIVDYDYANCCSSMFSAVEKERFHITDDGEAQAVFTADNLAAYLAVCKKYCDDVTLKGELEIKNGTATGMTFELQP